MAITTEMATSFKREVLEARHNFLASGGDTFKAALFLAAATLGAGTTAYSATNESSGTGYTAGGGTLTRVNPAISGTTAYTDFADFTWSASTITARGCLLYNSSASNAACSAHDFGSDKSSSGGDFVLQFPSPTASDAILRIA